MKHHTLLTTHKTYPLSIIGFMLSLLGIVLVGIIVIGISLYGLDKKENHTVQLGQYLTDGSNPAFFEFDVADSPTVIDKPVAIKVILDAQGHEVNGADFVIQYDPDKVRIETSFGDVFNRYAKYTNDNTVELSGWYTDTNHIYTGKGTFATLTVTPLTTQDVEIAAMCYENASNDSNIIVGDKDVIDCNWNPKVTFSVANNSSTTAETSCWDAQPERPSGLKAVSGPHQGQVTLTWNKADGATHYALMYGESWLDFKYGAPNVGDTDRFIVSSLRPGVGYYFAVTAVNGCASSGISDGAAAYAGVVPTYTTKTSQTSTTPKPSPKPTQVPSTSWSSQATQPTAQPTVKPTQPAVTPTPTIAPSLAMPSHEPTATGSGLATPSSVLLSRPSSTPTPVNVPPTDEEHDNWRLMAAVLPWIGLGLLIVLGGVLVSVVKQMRSNPNIEQ